MTLDPSRYTLDKIVSGEYQLRLGTDYTNVVTNEYVIKASYLENNAAGTKVTLKFDMADTEEDPELVINIVDSAPTYTVNVKTATGNNDLGTVEILTGAGPYKDGDTVQVKATPAEDSAFVEWIVTSGTLDIEAQKTNAIIEFTVTAETGDVELTATFGKIESQPFSSMLMEEPFDELTDAQMLKYFTFNGNIASRAIAIADDPMNADNKVLKTSWLGYSGSGNLWSELVFADELVKAGLADTTKPYTVFDFKVLFDNKGDGDVQGKVRNNFSGAVQNANNGEYISGTLGRDQAGNVIFQNTKWSGGKNIIAASATADKTWYDMRIVNYYDAAAERLR